VGWNSLSVASAFRYALSPTPTISAAVIRRDIRRGFKLKLESHNATGSIKYRTAIGLILMLERERPLIPGSVVIESTSGNLGLAMAALLGQIDCRFIAVIDPRTPAITRECLSQLDAKFILVEEPDQHGGFLLSRLRKVAQLCDANPGYRWPDQYRNPANPQIHEDTTGPEIAEQCGVESNSVYIAVSTGGTLAGVSRYLRRHCADIRIVAVDVAGSQAIVSSHGRRLVPGIGSSVRSSFLRESSYDDFASVSAAESFAMCRILRDDLGYAIGGSSGSVIYAMVMDEKWRETSLPLCLCPDDGTKYVYTIYSDRWLADQGLLAETHTTIDRLRAEGLHFLWTGEDA
jgi:cysteine synthase